MLPILHLNGYKIANPTILARMPEAQLEQLLRGYGHEPHFVTVTDPDDTAAAHRDFAAVLDRCLAEIRAIQAARRSAAGGGRTTPAADDAPAAAWPMIVLRSPKGWTGPEDGRRAAGGRHLAQPPGAAVRGPHQPRAPGAAGASGWSPTGRTNCSTATGGSGRTSPRTPPTGTCG